MRKTGILRYIALVLLLVATSGCVRTVKVLDSTVYGPNDKSLGEEAFDLNKTPGGGDVF